MALIEQADLIHEADRCGWDCEHPDHANRVTFTLPMLPLSVNSLYNVIFSQRRVELKPECRQFKTKAKVYIPAFKVDDDSLIRLDAVFHYRFHHKNGRLRKFDSPNLLKLLIDTVSEKIGIDDSRVKAGSWRSLDGNERVEVTLTEIHYDHKNDD